MTLIAAPFTVRAASGYGKTAWQVRDAVGYVVGRLVVAANADRMATLLNGGASLERLRPLLDIYAGRIEARVAEDSGGRFDIPLTVDGLEVACLRLRHHEPVQFYRDAKGEPAALAPDGSVVPLP